MSPGLDPAGGAPSEGRARVVLLAPEDGGDGDLARELARFAAIRARSVPEAVERGAVAVVVDLAACRDPWRDVRAIAAAPSLLGVPIFVHVGGDGSPATGRRGLDTLLRAIAEAVAAGGGSRPSRIEDPAPSGAGRGGLARSA